MQVHSPFFMLSRHPRPIGGSPHPRHPRWFSSPPAPLQNHDNIIIRVFRLERGEILFLLSDLILRNTTPLSAY